MICNMTISWFKHNGMVVNPTNLQIMICSRNGASDICLKINIIIVPEQNSVKLVIVIIDKRSNNRTYV